jgi:hypothetical protein
VISKVGDGEGGIVGVAVAGVCSVGGIEAVGVGSRVGVGSVVGDLVTIVPRV